MSHEAPNGGNAFIGNSAFSLPRNKPVRFGNWSNAGPSSIRRGSAPLGWSGGGSMSLNAIFRYPDLYRTVTAVAPVADQRLHDTIYQERYMGLPTDNAKGYRDGSPRTLASCAATCC